MGAGASSKGKKSRQRLLGAEFVPVAVIKTPKLKSPALHRYPTPLGNMGNTLPPTVSKLEAEENLRKVIQELREGSCTDIE
jgi:hypothetical protein